MLRNTPAILAVILGLSLCAAFYEGPVTACNADGGPFKTCTVGGGCVDCSAGTAANNAFTTACTAAGGSIFASDVYGDVCGY